ncbi:MAG: hypothetical protein BBJ57_06040 [Desulfobacterales bacterium PC51MH44]|nr:MAG: hypothetical protein BBJ57_06040 [Desulfobacterales bacterium PC51MH44]
MTSIIHAETPLQVNQARVLFQDYAASLDFDLCFQDFNEELRNLPGAYARPQGCLLLAQENDTVIGCVAMRPLEETVCEMKRMYVIPRFRGRGVGRLLANAVIAEAKQYGYQRMCLDTVSSMATAKALYKSLGFRQIPPYCHNPIPGAIYFELNLTRISHEQCQKDKKNL